MRGTSFRVDPLRRLLQGGASLIAAIALAGGLTLVAAVAGAATAGASPTCQAAGTTGLTAAVIVHIGQTLSNQTIDASSCDIGVYVPPTAWNVTIEHNTIFDANVHGIFVQDAVNTRILDNTVYGTGEGEIVNTSVTCDTLTNVGTAVECCGDEIHEEKAIELSGTSFAFVSGNDVYNNNLDGGIGVTDDGPIDPGAPCPGYLKPATNNTITGNVVYGNGNFESGSISSLPYGGGYHAIGLFAFNSGAGLANNVVEFNNVHDNSDGIGVATYADDTSVTDTTINGNTVVHNYGAGISLLGEYSDTTISGTKISGNNIFDNGGEFYDGDDQNTGVALLSHESSSVANTTVAKNWISDEYYGVFMNEVSNTTLTDNMFMNNTYNTYTY